MLKLIKRIFRFLSKFCLNSKIERELGPVKKSAWPDVFWQLKFSFPEGRGGLGPVSLKSWSPALPQLKITFFAAGMFDEGKVEDMDDEYEYEDEEEEDEEEEKKDEDDRNCPPHEFECRTEDCIALR